MEITMMTNFYYSNHFRSPRMAVTDVLMFTLADKKDFLFNYQKFNHTSQAAIWHRRASRDSFFFRGTIIFDFVTLSRNTLREETKKARNAVLSDSI